MMRMVSALVPLLTLPLLAGCEDDLESRNAAVQNAGAPVGEGGMVLTPGRQGDDRAAAEQDNGFAGEADGEELVLDAAPDDLIDNAEGFDPAPIDDAAGIDPGSEADDWGD